MTFTSPLTQIRVSVEFVLDREGIVIAKYVDRPMQGFSLREDSTLGGSLVASLAIARSTGPNGMKRRDLIGFYLVSRADSNKFTGGQEVWLESVEKSGLLYE